MEGNEWSKHWRIIAFALSWPPCSFRSSMNLNLIHEDEAHRPYATYNCCCRGNVCQIIIDWAFPFAFSPSFVFFDALKWTQFSFLIPSHLRSTHQIHPSLSLAFTLSSFLFFWSIYLVRLVYQSLHLNPSFPLSPVSHFFSSQSIFF